MNAEVIKAMNKKEKKHPVRKWWKNNSYKVWRVILFPVWMGAKNLKKIEDKLNARDKARNKWNEKKANEILNYYIPRTATWHKQDKAFFLFDNGYGWSINKKVIKIKDRRFWNRHRGFAGGKIRDYLINDFELDGFTKEIGNCSCGWTEITFRMIEE